MKKSMRLICLVLSLFVASLASGAAVGSWQAGTAREKITPTEPVWMTGYGNRDHPAEGTAQELWTKALAVADPAGNRGVVITADLCMISREQADAVAAELQKQFGLPRAAVMINVSHTHCGPWLVGVAMGMREPPPELRPRTVAYGQELERKMVRVAASALQTLAPATLSWSEDLATFAVNRRENVEGQVPALRAAGQLKGPTDHRVPTLAIRGADGQLRGVLVSYACHATTLSFYRWHGDYAGSAQLELERRHPGATALFVTGCGADQNPLPRRTVELADDYGRQLADAADRALAKTMTPVSGRFASAFERITLTFASKPTDAELREAIEKDQNKQWAIAVTEQLRTQGDRILNYDYPIQAWTLGNLSWIALGGEVVVDYALRLRKELPGNTWVFGYSNDVMAYIPNERILKEGRYEGETSMKPYGRPGPWSAGLEEKIVGKASELVTRTRAAR
jgi:neutral ceramidase